MRRWLLLGVAVVVLAGIAAAAFFFWPASLEAVAASPAQPTGPALIARGEYLTQAGDCAACHTIAGGQPFAGGLAFRLPFGTIYSPNITPDIKTGIGSWTDAEFLTAVHEGRAVVASLGPNQFLVAGIDCRVQFALPVHSGGKQPQMLKVEEGRYDGTTWIPTRLWNGDETDNGLNFGGKGSLLRITLGSY